MREGEREKSNQEREVTRNKGGLVKGNEEKVRKRKTKESDR